MSVSPSPLELVADIASICVDPAPASARAAAVLDRLAEYIPLEAAALSTFDPVEGRHITVAERGYPSVVLDYLNTGFAADDPAFLTMRFRNPTPLRWCDIPNYQGMFSAHEIFIPGGFREGATSCLFTRDGRYTGALHVSSDSLLPISDGAVETLIVLQRVIAPLIDAMRPPEGQSWTELLEEADEAGLLTGDRRLVTLPGLPRDRWLADGSPLALDLARREPVPRRFTWVSPQGRCHEVRTTILTSGTLVTIREAAAPHRLSPREVEVLTLLARGLANPEIGVALTLSPRTVATHVEHILAKMGCATRVAAASKAVAEGIVPASGPAATTALLGT
jgi:DNA-binding CsgD family transcriptional regulator